MSTICLYRLSRECLEGVKHDELSSSDAQRLDAEYKSSLDLSSLTDDSLQQLIDDLVFNVCVLVVNVKSKTAAKIVCNATFKPYGAREGTYETNYCGSHANVDFHVRTPRVSRSHVKLYVHT